MSRKPSTVEPINLAPEVWAYIAGFVDGEGCITAGVINKDTNPSYQLVINASQRSVEPLLWIQSQVGGKIYKYEGCYRWVCSQRLRIVAVLLGMLPYLKLKDRQARVAINMVRKTDFKVGGEADVYHKALKQLKRR